MKIMLLEGVRTPTDEKIVTRPRPISMITLQASKSHSSKAPKSEPFTHATPSGHDSATPMHTDTISPFTLELHMTSILQEQSGPQADRLGTLFEILQLHIARLEKVLYSTNNLVQMRLTTMETQLDAIQQKLEDSLSLFVPKRGRA